MPRVHLAQQQATAKTSQQVYDAGCEWCGTKISSLDQANTDGIVTYGLEYAHIFASAYAPAATWNGFCLCPTCHKVFDQVVKPRLQAAITKALTGFDYQPSPTSPVTRHVVGHTYEEVIERLISDKRPRGALPEPDKSLPKVKP